MWLLSKFLSGAIHTGTLVVTDHDGKEYTFGTGEGLDTRGPIRIKLTNKKAANHIARYPQLGAGEAFMWEYCPMGGKHAAELACGETSDLLEDLFVRGLAPVLSMCNGLTTDEVQRISSAFTQAKFALLTTLTLKLQY